MPMEMILRDKNGKNVLNAYITSERAKRIGAAGIIKYRDVYYTYHGLRDGIVIFRETGLYEFKD